MPHYSFANIAHGSLPYGESGGKISCVSKVNRCFIFIFSSVCAFKFDFSFKADLVKEKSKIYRKRVGFLHAEVVQETKLTFHPILLHSLSHMALPPATVAS